MTRSISFPILAILLLLVLCVLAWHWTRRLRALRCERDWLYRQWCLCYDVIAEQRRLQQTPAGRKDSQP